MVNGRIRGAKELDQVLATLPQKIALKHLRRALRVGANVLRAEARRRAPVRQQERLGPGYKPGKTYTTKDPKRQGFKVVRQRPPGFLKQQIVVGFRRQRVDGGLTASIGPSRAAFYGTFQEFGTSRHAAKPFLRPALDAKGDEAIRAVGIELGRALRTGRGFQ